MKDIPLGEVVLEQELEFVGADGSRQKTHVRLGKPVQDKDGPWFCPYLIEAQSFRQQFRMVGEDSLQAMLLAQKTIAVELKVLAKKHQGSFTWLGEADLGLP